MWGWTLCLCVIAVAAEESWLVQLAQGPVRGYKTDGDIFSFYGIPYATAPTGTNRYKPPLPPPSNEEPLEAVDTGIICPQAKVDPIDTTNKIMQEDCLIANVFVPNTEEKNLPVLVSVHGGAFQLGWGSWFSYSNLVKTKKMIIVTFNYRLGIHGFLCLGTKDAPGNVGMKDQVALLRWVKENIRAFGGNPNDVTIGGGSAGGASVDLLMMSKSTKGLYNKVIPESGSSMAAFSMQQDPLVNAKDFAKRLNFTKIDDINALQEFYKNAKIEQLMIDPFTERHDSSFLFSPCVERNVGDEVFLDDYPENIIKKGTYEKLPLLIGFANMEGLMRLQNFETWKTAMNDNFADFLPADLKFESEEKRQEVAKTIKEFYFGDKPVDNETILSYIDYFSDVLFTISALRSVELHLKNGHDKIYLYEYSFTDDNDPLIPHTEVRGASHCAQTMALLDGKNLFDRDESAASKELKKMKSIMREMWSNFITVGEPVPKGSSLPSWPPVGPNWTPYMSLGRTLQLQTALLEQRVRFWDKIYAKYFYTPVPPPLHTKINTEL